MRRAQLRLHRHFFAIVIFCDRELDRKTPSPVVPERQSTLRLLSVLLLYLTPSRLFRSFSLSLSSISSQRLQYFCFRLVPYRLQLLPATGGAIVAGYVLPNL